MNELVKASNISKVYHFNKENQVIALANINLTIEQGEFVVIMGPSGAGKSTLLSVLTTILEPTSGEVIIDGKKISQMDELARSRFRYSELGFIYQNFNLIDSLTIYENIALPLSLADDSKQEINQKVNETASHLGIQTILNKYPNECSGGQLQRVAVARTLANSPKLIVADEPTGNLDSVNSHGVMKLLSQLNQEGTTIVLVTHDSTIASYGNRLLYINDGVIEKEIQRGKKDKKTYFNEIVNLNSKEIFFEEDN